MKSVKELNEEVVELSASIEALATLAESENRELTDDENAEADRLLAAKENIQEKLLPRAIQLDKNRSEAKARFQGTQASRDDLNDPQTTPKKIVVPARAKAHRTKVFKGETANEDAYLSGRFLLATIGGHEGSRKWCADHGIDIRGAMSEGTNSAGGFLVPDPLSATVINLQEEYGVFQRNTRVVPMTAETLAVPRRTGGLTVYYPGENTAITASDLTFAQATLTAKKYAALALMSTELNEDALISMADLIADEMARRFANAIDTNAFIGDGTSTYASVTGFDSALHTNSTIDAASGNTSFETLDLADFEKVVGSVPVYPGAMNKWYISSYGYWQSMARLMDAAGGNAISDLGSGPVRSFLGYPVEFTQVLPSTSVSAGDNVAYFGDISLASSMGMRRDIAIATSTEVKFIEDQIAIKGTERVAITVHEGTAASPVGPVVAVTLAAS